jgi:hypothetical protein
VPPSGAELGQSSHYLARSPYVVNYQKSIAIVVLFALAVMPRGKEPTVVSDRCVKSQSVALLTALPLFAAHLPGKSVPYRPCEPHIRVVPASSACWQALQFAKANLGNRLHESFNAPVSYKLH